MKIIVTTSFINSYGDWQKFCTLTGYGYYSPADDHEVVLSLDYAIQIFGSLDRLNA